MPETLLAKNGQRRRDSVQNAFDVDVHRFLIRAAGRQSLQTIQPARTQNGLGASSIPLLAPVMPATLSLIPGTQCFYSTRSASMGSMFVARRAGK
jgi:hypothetical protein